jgi:hypothetical protein
MQKDLQAERRTAERQWSKREKQIQRVIANTAGMYGDLQGIIGTSLQAIPALTEGDEDAPEAAPAALGTSVRPEVVEDEDVESDDTSPTLAALVKAHRHDSSRDPSGRRFDSFDQALDRFS